MPAGGVGLSHAPSLGGRKLTPGVTLCLDDAVGETRRLLVDAQGRAFRLETERWSERGKRARLGELWLGIARVRTSGGRGWFVDLGLERDGYLEPRRDQPVTDGVRLAVVITSEAQAEKGPVLALARKPAAAPEPSRPGLWHREMDAFAEGCSLVQTLTGMRAREAVDAALELAAGAEVPLPGGGRIFVESTRAATAIDVDAGARASSRSGFELALNLAAAEEAARQISLRSLGGLVVIDFLRMREVVQRREIAACLRRSLQMFLGRRPDVLEISALGLCEAAVPRTRRALALSAAATAPEEREALAALRAIETQGWSDRAKPIRARLSHAAAAWLERDPPPPDGIGWRAALAERIGERWRIEVESGAQRAPEVWSER